MAKRIDEICSHVPHVDVKQIPSSNPIYGAAVYRCETTREADQLLAGEVEGYVYQRDGHPNADVLAEQCRQLHGAEKAIVTSSGMAALSLAVLSLLRQGDHLLVSDRLYGRSTKLFQHEFPRWGLETTAVDFCDLEKIAAGMRGNTKMLVVETISNPLLRVADLTGISELARQQNALLLVDNTFATPAVCKPILCGADLVMESVSKMMNGHSDLMLGMLCGSNRVWDRVRSVCAAWGFTSSPQDCWLASRGLSTLHLRIKRACDNARLLARALKESPHVQHVCYPGDAADTSHSIATRLFETSQTKVASRPESVQTATGNNVAVPDLLYGNMVTFRLPNDRNLADRFISAAKEIAFFPSLGDVVTTISHPLSTSHRHLSSSEQVALGIDEGTIRVSVGIESAEFVLESFRHALLTLD